MTFKKKLDFIVTKNNSLLCVGLDSDIDKIPQFVRETDHPQFNFNKAIIDATHDLVCAYKPNTAFYEQRGNRGIEALKMTCDYIKLTYPEIPIIIDAKRGDIGNTNNGYIKFIFEYLGADSLTLHPYFGQESLAPFLALKDKGLIILCRSSNPGGGEFQDLKADGEPLYKIVARKVINEWNKNDNCLLMIGATYPEEMKEVRRIAGDMDFLVPGIGVQGGDVEKTVKAGLNTKKAGMIINSSRGIIFASNYQDFAEKARIEAIKTKDEVNKYRV